MGSSKGGGGNPSAFTGGLLSAPPPGGFTPSTPNVVPSYASFLPSGAGMATPESVAAAALVAPKPVAPPGAMYAPGGPPMNEDALRALLARMMPVAPAAPPRDFGPYTMANGMMGYNYRGGANRSGGGGFGGGYGSSGGGGYSTSARGGSSSSAGYGGGMGGRRR